MPAVKLVNIAPSVPEPPKADGEHLPSGAQIYLHQTQGNIDPGTGQEIRDGKPIPRDPTATLPKHGLGPRLTDVIVPDYGGVYCKDAGVMVNRDLTAADQARAVVHDWAMHSDCALPAFVLPATDAKADHALAKAVQARFVSKAPSAATAEEYGRAFQISGRGDRADAAFQYLHRAVGLTPHLLIPGAEGYELQAAELMLFLAAQNAEKWDAMLEHIAGPTALILNAGVDDTHSALFGTVYLGLSANATAPAGGDTSMTGEITTAGAGLAPAVGTYAHTNGTGTCTVTRTATANGTDTLPVSPAQMSLRTASGGGGTLRVKELFSGGAATLSAIGDALTVTYTPTVASS